MAYDENVAGRLREILARHDGITERKMFGGLSFMLRGHMFCGVIGHDLVVRVGPDQHAEALAEPHAKPMDFTGRAFKGFVYVGPGGFRSEEALVKWIQRGMSFAASLPAKPLPRRKPYRP